MKKQVALFLVVLSILSLIGCGKSNNTSTKSTVNTAVSEENNSTTGVNTADLPTIKWFVNLSYFNYGGTWGEDLVSEMIMEKCGVNIEFVAPASDGNEELTAMLASGDIPDLITIGDPSLLHQMVKEGFLISYSDLAEDNEQLKTSLEARPDVYAYWQDSTDNKTYGMPNYAYSQEDVPENSAYVSNAAFIIRNDFMDAIGNPEINTVDDFFAAIDNIVETVGTYNGQNLIPVQCIEGVQNSMFGVTQMFATPAEDESGNYVYDMTQWQYKEALQFINQCYNKGYLKPENFSDTRDQVTENIASGKVIAAFVSPQDFVDAFKELYQSDNDATYTSFFIKNSKGEDPVLSDISGMGWLTTCIGKDSRYLDEIATLVGYLMSDEGIINMCFGEEGVTYEVDADGNYVATDTYQAALDADEDSAYNLNSVYLFANYAYSSQFEPIKTDPDEIAIDAELMKEATKQYAHTYPSYKFDPDDERADTMNELGTKITNYRAPMIAKIMTASSNEEFENLYTETLNMITAYNGFEDLCDYNNKAWQAGKAVLGLAEGEVWWPNN